MANNDVNLYVTYSECAPMLPLESFETGTPCICANNNHYFEDSKLNDMVVVNNETDINEIKDKILFAVNNKDEIIKEYNKFKKNNNANKINQLKEFLGK